jgi:hypothetical protein
MEPGVLPSLEDDLLGFLVIKNFQLAAVLAFGLAMKVRYAQHVLQVMQPGDFLCAHASHDVGGLCRQPSLAA